MWPPMSRGFAPSTPQSRIQWHPTVKRFGKSVSGQQPGSHPVHSGVFAEKAFAGLRPSLLPAPETSSAARKVAATALSPVFPFPLAPARPLHPFPLHHVLGRQCQAGERRRPAARAPTVPGQGGRRGYWLPGGWFVLAAHWVGAVLASQSPSLAQRLCLLARPWPMTLVALAQGEGRLPRGCAREGPGKRKPRHAARLEPRSPACRAIGRHGSCAPSLAAKRLLAS